MDKLSKNVERSMDASVQGPVTVRQDIDGRSRVDALPPLASLPSVIATGATSRRGERLMYAPETQSANVGAASDCWEDVTLTIKGPAQSGVTHRIRIRPGERLQAWIPPHSRWELVLVDWWSGILPANGTERHKLWTHVADPQPWSYRRVTPWIEAKNTADVHRLVAGYAGLMPPAWDAGAWVSLPPDAVCRAWVELRIDGAGATWGPSILFYSIRRDTPLELVGHCQFAASCSPAGPTAGGMNAIGLYPLETGGGASHEPGQLILPGADDCGVILGSIPAFPDLGYVRATINVKVTP